MEQPTYPLGSFSATHSSQQQERLDAATDRTLLEWLKADMDALNSRFEKFEQKLLEQAHKPPCPFSIANKEKVDSLLWLFRAAFVGMVGTSAVALVTTILGLWKKH